MPLPQHEGYRSFELSWSPDGRWFAYVTAHHSTAPITQLWLVSTSGGEPVPVTDGRTNTWNPLWSPDSRRLFYVSNRGGAMDLWQQRVAEDGTLDGPPEAVTTGLGIGRAAFTPDGSRFAYSRDQLVSNLWRVPILDDRPATWAEAMQLVAGSRGVYDVSPDGRVLFVSMRGGTVDLWSVPREGGEITPVTSDAEPRGSARWSPDATKFASGSTRSGNQEVWIVSTGGGPAMQMTDHPAEDGVPTWSPDGREIAFVSTRARNRDIWVMPSEGGEPRQLTSHPGIEYFPDWSPDGEWVVFHSWRSGSLRLWRIPAAGGEAEMISAGPGIHARWSRSGEVVYFVGWEERRDLWALSLGDGREYLVTDLTGRRGRPGWFLATDDEHLYFPWWEELGDIWMMDVEWSGR